MVVILKQVSQIGCNASDSLNLLCLGLERKAKCYNRYTFHTKSMFRTERPIIVEFVLNDQF